MNQTEPQEEIFGDGELFDRDGNLLGEAEYWINVEKGNQADRDGKSMDGIGEISGLLTGIDLVDHVGARVTLKLDDGRRVGLIIGGAQGTGRLPVLDVSSQNRFLERVFAKGNRVSFLRGRRTIWYTEMQFHGAISADEFARPTRHGSSPTEN